MPSEVRNSFLCFHTYGALPEHKTVGGSYHISFVEKTRCFRSRSFLHICLEFLFSRICCICVVVGVRTNCHILQIPFAFFFSFVAIHIPAFLAIFIIGGQYKVTWGKRIIILFIITQHIAEQLAHAFKTLHHSDLTPGVFWFWKLFANYIELLNLYFCQDTATLSCYEDS